MEDGYADQSCLPDVILRVTPIAACPLHLGRLVLPQLPDLAPTSMDATDRQVSSASSPCLPPGHTLVRMSSSGAPRGASTAEAVGRNNSSDDGSRARQMVLAGGSAGRGQQGLAGRECATANASGQLAS